MPAPRRALRPRAWHTARTRTWSASFAASLALFEGYAADRGVSIRMEGADAVHLWGQPLHLKQVTTNLLANAIKFTPHGGAVTVGVRTAEGEGGGRNGRRVAELVVSDTGPGVPPSERDRVFERGVRLARDAQTPGHGIGLSVVRELVTRDGGTVTLRASPSGGAEFVVRLPLDLRGRPRDALVLVRDERSVEQVVRAVREALGRGDLTRAPADLAAALEACRAVVLVENGASLFPSLEGVESPAGSDDPGPEGAP